MATLTSSPVMDGELVLESRDDLLRGSDVPVPPVPQPSPTPMPTPEPVPTPAPAPPQPEPVPEPLPSAERYTTEWALDG